MLGQMLLDEVQVARPPEVLPGQHDEQRRGVHAAVVTAKRDLVQQRHLALAGFVQDLARLGVRLGNRLRGLRRGQIREDAARHAGTHPQASPWP